MSRRPPRSRPGSAAFAAAVGERKDELTELDQAIGDADHGINMDRGMRAVVEKLDGGEPGDVGGAHEEPSR